MMKLKIILLTAIILAAAFDGFAQSGAGTPDTVVKNIYAAQKSGRNPFLQTKSRALLDKYFTKKLADLIWKDLKDSTAKNEVGNLDFDPFYDAQDTKITAFKVGAPDYGEGNRNLADVPVSFKNFGKSEKILFRLEKTGGAWKISDIYYPADNTSLKKILAG